MRNGKKNNKKKESEIKNLKAEITKIKNSLEEKTD